MESSRGAALQLRGVSKSYGSVGVLEQLDLTVEQGEVYAFLGRNGAGKSTSVRIAMGITRPDSGQICMFGQTVAASDPKPRRRVGYVAQEQHFYEWMTPRSIGDFVRAFYPSWQREEYPRLLQRLELPNRKIGTFSGGMKVKLALALALAHEPELMIFDEPTAGLDPVARRELIDIIGELAATGRHTVLFSTHLVDDVARLATRVGVLERGALRYEGSLEGLSRPFTRLILPATGSEEAARAKLSDLSVEVLSSREVAGRLELVLRLGDSSPRERLLSLAPGARLEALSLEDAFVSLVRSGTLLESGASAAPASDAPASDSPEGAGSEASPRPEAVVS